MAQLGSAHDCAGAPRRARPRGAGRATPPPPRPQKLPGPPPPPRQLQYCVEYCRAGRLPAQYPSPEVDPTPNLIRNDPPALSSPPPHVRAPRRS